MPSFAKNSTVIECLKASAFELLEIVQQLFLFDLSGGQSVGQLLGLRQINIDIVLIEKT